MAKQELLRKNDHEGSGHLKIEVISSKEAPEHGPSGKLIIPQNSNLTEVIIVKNDCKRFAPKSRISTEVTYNSDDAIIAEAYDFPNL